MPAPSTIPSHLVSPTSQSNILYGSNGLPGKPSALPAVPAIHRVADNQLDMFEHKLLRLKTGQSLVNEPEPDIGKGLGELKDPNPWIFDKPAAANTISPKPTTAHSKDYPDAPIHHGWSTTSRYSYTPEQLSDVISQPESKENTPSPLLSPRHPIFGGLQNISPPGLMTTSRVHASLGTDLLSNTSIRSTFGTASLSRGMRSFVDKLMVAPFQAAATSTVMAANHVANMAVPDDPSTVNERKVLTVIHNMYTRMSGAVRNYQAAVYTMIESEAMLADVLLQEAGNVMTVSSPNDTTPPVPSSDRPAINVSRSSLIDSQIAPILEDYGRLMQSHALQSIGYARALDAFENQLNSFLTHALADCLETQRQTNAVYTELEIYRATGIAHLVAVNHHLSQGLHRAAVAPFEMLARSQKGNFSHPPEILNEGHEDGVSSPIPDINPTSQEANNHHLNTSTDATKDKSDRGNSEDQRKRSKSEARSLSLNEVPNVPRSASTHMFQPDSIFANDTHAQSLRKKHGKLMDALKAKTRVLQDKVVTDLSAQFTALTSVNAHSSEQQTAAGAN